MWSFVGGIAAFASIVIPAKQGPHAGMFRQKTAQATIVCPFTKNQVHVFAPTSPGCEAAALKR
ncbi:MAG: hypothetical protein JWR59_2327 [Brevundimonas sp.]|nr:hypothetical protein [Brevundimonas sp.]